MKECLLLAAFFAGANAARFQGTARDFTSAFFSASGTSVGVTVKPDSNKNYHFSPSSGLTDWFTTTPTDLFNVKPTSLEYTKVNSNSNGYAVWQVHIFLNRHKLSDPLAPLHIPPRVLPSPKSPPFGHLISVATAFPLFFLQTGRI
jgi:hypothetical protein